MRIAVEIIDRVPHITKPISEERLSSLMFIKGEECIKIKYISNAIGVRRIKILFVKKK